MATKVIGLKISIQDANQIAKLEQDLIKLRQERSRLNKRVKEGNGLNAAEAQQLGRLKAKTDETRKALNEKTKALTQNNAALKKNSGFVAGVRKGVSQWATSMIGVTAAVAGAAKAVGFVTDEIKEANGALRTSNQLFNESSAIIEKTTANALALASTFDKEVNDVLKSASILSNEFGISSLEATKLIEDGFRKGADVNGEFLELLKEYPAQLKTVGLSAEESIALITQTEQAGIFSDKGIDAIKEAGIRLRELTPATRDALDAIGISSKEIETQLENGTISLFEATQKVSNKIAELPPNSAKVGTAIADIFGGAGEDAGARFITGIGQIDTEFENLENKLTDVQEAQLGLSKVWEEFIVSTTEGGTIIGDAYAGILNKATEILDTLTKFSRGDLFGIGIDQVEGLDEKVGKLNITVRELTKAQQQDLGIFEALKKAYSEGTISVDKFEKGIKKLADGYVRGAEKVKEVEATSGEESSELTPEEIAAINKKAKSRAEAEAKAKKDALSEIEQREADDLAASEEGEFSEEEPKGLFSEEEKAAIAADYEELKALREQENADEIADAERTAAALKKIEELKKQATVERLNIVAGALDAAASFAEKGSAQQKALSSALTLISTYLAAQQAYQSQMALFTPDAPIRATAAAAVAVAQGLARVKAINSVKAAKGMYLEDGGMIKGASHANGGVPFTVDGVGGFEAEGGEAIINKRSTAMFAPLLSQINQAGGGVAFKRGGLVSKFQNGGTLTPNNVGVTAQQQGLFNNAENLSDLGDTIISGFNDKEVINVATNTSEVATEVINTEAEASF